MKMITEFFFKSELKPSFITLYILFLEFSATICHRFEHPVFYDMKVVKKLMKFPFKILRISSKIPKTEVCVICPA